MILSILNQLEATSGRLAKQAILRKNDSATLRKVLIYALDPYRMFYMHKVPKAKPAAKSRIAYADLFVQLDRLANRTVTGGKAEVEVTNFLANCDEDTQEVFRRIIQKDLRCGVSSGTVNRVFKKLIPEYKMTGAKGYDEEKLEESLPRIAEPKYDGMRLNALLGTSVATSEIVSGRSGKPVNTFDDFIPALFEIWPEGNMVIDGEAMGVGVSFQDGMSIIKRKEADGRAKKFVIFDVITKAEFDAKKCKVPYTERVKRRRPIPKKYQHMLEYPPSWPVNTIDEVQAKFRELRSLDPDTGKPFFEGLIIKVPSSPYHFKKHADWMKVKPLETVDLEVVDVTEGKGKYAGKGIGALMFKYGKQDVRAGTGFSDKQRWNFWKNKNKIIGQIAELEFMEETDAGKTRHAVFVRMRSYKGEKS